MLKRWWAAAWDRVTDPAGRARKAEATARGLVGLVNDYVEEAVVVRGILNALVVDRGGSVRLPGDYVRAGADMPACDVTWDRDGDSVTLSLADPDEEGEDDDAG